MSSHDPPALTGCFRIYPLQYLTALPPEYGSSGVLQDPSSFGPYAQPPYTAQMLYPASGVQEATDHIHYGASPDFALQHQMEQSRTVPIDQRFRQFPRITSSSQFQGLEGSTVSIYIQSTHELRASPRIVFSLLFASKRVECALQLVGEPQCSPKQYAISAEVPPFTSTGWHALEVPLRVMMASIDTTIPPLAVEVGTFNYSGQIISQDSFRKRKFSSDSADAMHRPIKKSSAQQLLGERVSENGASNTSPYSTYVSTPAAGSLPPSGSMQAASPRPSAHKYSASIASANSIKAQSPHTPPSWSPSFTPVNQDTLISKSSATPIRGSTVDAVTGKMPTLIRTTTLSQSSLPMNPITAPQSFNLYAMYPSKAVLKLNGDLDSMAESWSLEEWDIKRRLVQFTRRQNVSTIHADFKAVAPEDRQPNSICISCIWWEEKKDCYVTSVDTIFLLESLVAVRFTVEEKNRIRRNLEGFRPLTVSKSKADSEEFFKIIMGFPSPKPRNIEKDVKVFPWKILAHALKKIIGKYSASYSSTAAAIPTPMASHYNSNGASDSRTDSRASASPQITGINHGGSPYPPSTASYSPHMSQQRISVPISNGPPTDLRLQMPSMVPHYSYPATHSHPHVSTYSHPMRHSPQPMTAPAVAGRIVGSWDSGDDFTTFDHDNPDSGVNMAAFNYNRILSGMPSSQGYVPSNSYSLTHSGI